MTKNSELNDPIIPWLDLSAYGLCLFKLDSTAQGKHWIVVSGDIEQHGETLACLGLRRSARGVMFLPVIGDRWKLTPEWKRAFPELTIKPMPVSQVVVQAADPVVVRSETVAHPVATLQHAAPESPGLTDGAKIAGGTSRVRRTETAAVGSDAGDRSAEEPRTATPAGESGDRNGRRDAAQALTPAEAGAWFGEIALAQRQAGLIRTFELLGAALTNGDLDTVTDILSNTSNRHTRAAFVDITGMSLPRAQWQTRELLVRWMGAPAADQATSSSYALRYVPAFFGTDALETLTVEGQFAGEPAQVVFKGVASVGSDRWLVMAEARGARVTATDSQALSGVSVQGRLDSPARRVEFALTALPGFELRTDLQIEPAVEPTPAPVSDLAAADTAPIELPLNFRIPDELAARFLTERPADSMRRQMEILNILRVVAEEARPPSEAERACLAGYSGWGPFAGELLKPDVRKAAADDYAGLIESTPNAFYTPPPVIDAMWQMAIRAGFRAGRVLEPGAGAGWFIGRVPEQLVDRTQFVAVEKEPVAVKVLEHLYPRATVFGVDFRHAPIAENSVDLVIGNVPYGDQRVTDTRYADTYSLHDYFLINSLRVLRPGGVLIALTSTYTLDRVSPVARDEMYRVADLEAGFRLPMGALVKTDVSADVLVFRKRLPFEAPKEFIWRLSTGAENAPPLNAAFATGLVKPIGEIFVHATNGPGGTRNAVTGADRSPAYVGGRMVEGSPESIFSDRQEVLSEVYASRQVDEDEDPQRVEGLFVLAGDGMASIENGQPVPMVARGKALARLQQYVPMREAARAVLRAQLNARDDEALKSAQTELTQAYDGFVAKFGPVNLTPNRRAILDDPFHDLVLALEDFDPESETAKKTEFFSERTIVVRDEPTPRNPIDALLASIDRYAKVNPAAMAGWLRQSWSEIRQELRGHVYDDPVSGVPELAEVYCSGNLREKLVVAQEASRKDSRYQENVEALQVALGAFKQRDKISVSLGAPWVDPAYYAQFLKDVIYTSSSAAIGFSVTRDPLTSRWRIKLDRSLTEPPSYSTEHWKARDLVESIMNGRTPKVFHPRSPDDVGPSRLDERATLLAEQKAEAIRRSFASWIWSDDERAVAVERRFNETLNAYRGLRVRDLPITLPGLAADKTPRWYQLRGVARVVMERRLLLGHEVGAGKTLTMVASAVKLRQLGIAAKSLMVVKKSTLYSIFSEAKRFFPLLRVAMIETGDLNPAGRKAFLRRIQTQRPDLIITTQEAFKKLAPPAEVEVRETSRTLAKIERAVEDAQGSRHSNSDVKRLGKQLSTMRARLQELLGEDGDAKKKKVRETRVTLDQLGIGALFVDEAQAYKNLQVLTSEPMLGIPTSMSARAHDMAMKVHWLESQGSVVVFATGTPITNSLVETFNLQRFLAPEQLRSAGLEEFDAWKSVFAMPVLKIEPDPGGKGYRAVQRLAGMKNIPPLVDMLSTFTDVVTGEDLKIPRPPARHITVQVEPTGLQKLFRAALAEETQIVRTLPEVAKDMKINILTVLGKARRAALDLRAVYPFITDEGGEKIDAVVDNVARIFHKTRDIRATQAIFCDLATPKGPGERGFSAYDAIRNGLIDAGVPANEIAFIHDCRNDREKEQLFIKVQQGNIAVLLGSTEKMGEGCNIQFRLLALHHMNAPYHPGQLTQRNGRIERFGNMNMEGVECYYYTTKGLLEDWNWSLVHTKQGFISQVIGAVASHSRDRASELPSFVQEDAAAVDLGEIEAAASGDPRVRDKFALEGTVRELTLLVQARNQERAQYASKIRDVNGELEHQARLKVEAEQLAEKIMNARKLKLADGDSFAMGVFDNGPYSAPRKFTVRRDAGDALLALVKSIDERHSITGTTQRVAVLDTQDVYLSTHPARAPSIAIGPRFSALSESKIVSHDAVGVIRTIENAVETIALQSEKIGYNIGSLEKQRATLTAAMTSVDDLQERLDSATAALTEINIELQATNAVDVGGCIQAFHAELLRRFGRDGRDVSAIVEDTVERFDDEDEESNEEPGAAAFERLLRIVPNLKEVSHAKLKAPGECFMDLVVETLRRRGDTHEVSLAHYYEQNHDLIPDPEMVVLVDWERQRVEPVSFGMQGIYRAAERSPAEAADQASFLVQWLRNIESQGHGQAPLPTDPSPGEGEAPEAVDERPVQRRRLA